MYQPGIDFKCAYSNRPLKPFTRLIGLRQGGCDSRSGAVLPREMRVVRSDGGKDNSVTGEGAA
jgi:hypothetical protein